MKNPLNIFGRIRKKNSPRYKRPHYDDVESYVEQIKEYFETLCFMTKLQLGLLK